MNNLRSLGQARLAMLAGTGVAIVVALFVGMRLLLAPDFVQIYSGMNPGAAGAVVDTLEQAGFSVRLEDAGASVSVPAEDLPRARMALAEKGLPGDGTPGWELFDETSGLGMNSFLQRVNRLRALEGELARSIQTIQGVAAARVHLVLPEREAFTRERPEPTASVIVRGTGSRQISRRQARAIRALVAAAVPDLSASRVAVLSASGETILAEEGDGTSEITLQSVRTGIEERMASNIAALLSARVGAGNARVQVSVDLSSERQVIRQQSFDPSQQVIRSTETREETREDRKTAGGEVGVANNVPAELAGNQAGNAIDGKSSESTREIVNYEIGKTESETILEPGQVERVSVAVLVNGIYNVADDGSVDYAERDPAELARLEGLIKSAVGFDAARGDVVSVDSLRFMDYSMDVGEPAGLSIGQLISTNFMAIMRGLLSLALVGAVLIFGVRPLLKQVREMSPSMQLAGAGAPVGLGDATPDTPRIASDSATPAAGGTTPAIGQNGSNVGKPAPAARTGTVLPPESPQDVVQVASVSGGVQRGWIDVVGEVIESHPEESLRVVKSWLAEP